MKKEKQGQPKTGGSLRDKIRHAADSIKERAKNMNSEEKVLEQEQVEETQTEAAELDAAALKEELEKTKAQCE